MKILITGVAGFIGFKFTELLLKNNYRVVGVDNLNDYYDVKLKKDRLRTINKYKNFKFVKVNLNKEKKIKQIFYNHKFDYVFHFAAQAGVRFAITSPRDYIDSNINAFFNILHLSKKNKIKRLFISSSSSVYGDKNKFPSKENFYLNPNNIYSLSKKFNEDLSKSYSEFYDFRVTALRFFTVYGEWGRPDMFLMKFLESNKKKKHFYLNNNGNHHRDFTYINDVTEILFKLFKLPQKNKFEIYNICGNRPIKISKLVRKLENLIGETKIIVIKKNKADVNKTHGSNTKIVKKIKGFRFTPIDEGLKFLKQWFDDYYTK